MGHQAFSIPFPLTHPWMTPDSLPCLQFLAGKHTGRRMRGFLPTKRWSGQEQEQRHQRSQSKPLSCSKNSSPVHPRQQDAHLGRCRAKPALFLVILGRQEANPPRMAATHGHIPGTEGKKKKKEKKTQNKRQQRLPAPSLQMSSGCA